MFDICTCMQNVCKGGWSKCPMAKACESKHLLHESMRPRGPGPQLRQYETMIPTCTGTLINKLFHFKQTLGAKSTILYINAQFRLQGAINVRFHNNTSTETKDALTN